MFSNCFRKEILMDDVLTRAVWKVRKKDEGKEGKEVNVTLISTGGNSYQLYFPSKGCRYACTMCNYGFGHPIREAEILKDLNRICDNLPENMENIILESSGSFLDETELPEQLQEKIMKRIAKTSLPQVQIETHYTTITNKKIRKIKKIFESKNIVFELGLESTNPEVFKIYNKFMDLDELLKTIWMCDRNGIEISLNLIVGAPLLTISERIQDTIDSIYWILENCPKSTSIVLFPLNIKDYTLVRHMYDQERYIPVQDWEFIEVLAKIPEEEIERIYISWWGNRCNEFHGEKAIIKPYHCDECHEALMTFYKKFVESQEKTQKTKLIHGISSHKCSCRKKFLQLMRNQEESKISYSQRLEEEKEKLKLELNLL